MPKTYWFLIFPITADTVDVKGSAYTQKQYIQGGFSASFSYTVGGGRGDGNFADGIAFVVQNAGTNALGSLGENLNFYGPIFDLYFN